MDADDRLDGGLDGGEVSGAGEADADVLSKLSSIAREAPQPLPHRGGEDQFNLPLVDLRTCRCRDLCQVFDDGVGKQIPHGHGNPGRECPGHHLHRQQRIAPTLKETVVAAEVPDPEDGLHRCGQRTLGRVPRQFTSSVRRYFGGGEPLLVHLPVASQGQRVDGHHDLRAHVWGQELLDVLAHFGDQLV